MPRKIQNTTKANIINVPLPNHGASYTVISHQFVIDYAHQALANAGFGIVEEEYRCTADGQIAQGVYKLSFNNDPELSMMFAWTNSYNKQVKFKCVIGAYINQTGSVMISGDMGSWVRKHMGTADTETKATIDDYITNAHMYYNQLVADKTLMKEVMLNTRKQAQLLGVLFAEYGILTTEQASFIRDQMKRPSFTFESNDSLWAFYNYVTLALQQSHPRTWMEDQRILHHFISSIYNFNQCNAPAQIEEPVEETIEDPLSNNYGEPENQTNLLVQIAEVTGDESVLEPTKTFNDTLQEAMIEKVEEDTKTLEAAVWGTTPEPIEDELTIADDDSVLGSILAPTVPDVVQYTDPVGNVFDLPDLKIDTIDLNEVTKQAVIVIENVEDTDEDIFAEEDNFDLDEDLPSLKISTTEENAVDLTSLPVIEKEDDDFNFDLDLEDSGDDGTPDFF